MKQIKLVKSIFAAAAVGAFLTAGASAFAADSADLSVTGTIVPGACQASLSGNGTVDFGTINAADLAVNDYTKLPEKMVDLTVSCASPRRVSFKVVDNQKASVMNEIGPTVGVDGGIINGTFVYGLGTTKIYNSDVKLGGYALTLATVPTVDGALAPAMGPNVLGFWAASTTDVHIGNELGLTYAPLNQIVLGLGTPMVGKEFVFPIKVIAGINKASNLPINDSVKLNGQATFQIVYQ